MNTRIGIALLLGMLTSGAVGYSQGKAVAAGSYERLLAESAQQQAQEREGRYQEDRQRLEAVAQVERDARERLQAESTRTAELASQLNLTRKQLAEERQLFNRRLSDVSNKASSSCRGLPPEWVRLYNAAARAPAADTRHRTRSSSDSPARYPDTANTAGTTATGLQSDESLTSPEDILAHVRDYGEYCRTVEAQRDTLLRLVNP